jgi:hypothetical protein
MSEIPLWARASDVRTLALGSGCEAGWLMSNLYNAELPDTTWFALGTALHTGIEKSIDDELDNPYDAVDYVQADIEIAKLESPDMIQSASKRAKRTKDSMMDDAERIIRKWWDDVHPDSKLRKKIFDQYQWPPKVEHVIDVDVDPKQGMILNTQVDAIFTARQDLPFGAEIAIVDWKTGSTAKAHDSQLHIYAYGGRKEGWYTNLPTEPVGFFWHVDHSKPQMAGPYLGDDVVENWILSTYMQKDRIINAGPTYNPDWWCPYCRARDYCPVNGGSKAVTTVIEDIEKAIRRDHPALEEVTT